MCVFFIAGQKVFFNYGARKNEFENTAKEVRKKNSNWIMSRRIEYLSLVENKNKDSKRPTEETLPLGPQTKGRAAFFFGVAFVVKEKKKK